MDTCCHAFWMSSIVTITLQSIYYKIFCQQLPLLSPSLRAPLFIDRKEPALRNSALKKFHRNLRTTSVPASLVFHHAMPRHATQAPPMLNSCKNVQTKLKRKPCMLAKQRKDFRLPFPTVVEGRGGFFSSKVAIIICRMGVSVSKPG